MTRRLRDLLIVAATETKPTKIATPCQGARGGRCDDEQSGTPQRPGERRASRPTISGDRGLDHEDR
jgi:hypothetical protein